jgi:GH24 family phage-related lysozyme (muramidase)
MVMTDADYAFMREMLGRHEGVRYKLYVDTVGKVSGGIGRNLTDKGFRPDEVELMFKNDLIEAWKDCEEHIPGFDEMPTKVRYAFVDIMFNMGWPTFSKFHNTLASTAAKDWDGAASHLSDSKWDKQVGKRADELQQMIKEG